MLFLHMKHVWFAAKRYGYGWYPVTWQGWSILLGFLVLLLLPMGIPAFEAQSRASEMTFALFYVGYSAVLTTILLWICFKTGEPARWRWGGE